MADKVTAYNENFGEKYPSAHEKVNRHFATLADVWSETFPNSRAIAVTKME
jgi:hypothetical protein